MALRNRELHARNDDDDDPMQVKLSFVTTNLNCRLHSFCWKPFEWISNFWTFWFLKTESELIFSFPQTRSEVVRQTDAQYLHNVKENYTFQTFYSIWCQIRRPLLFIQELQNCVNHMICICHHCLVLQQKTTNCFYRQQHSNCCTCRPMWKKFLLCNAMHSVDYAIARCLYRVMDDESGDDDRDELTSEWGGESTHDWRGWLNESERWFQRWGDVRWWMFVIFFIFKPWISGVPKTWPHDCMDDCTA